MTQLHCPLDHSSSCGSYLTSFSHTSRHFQQCLDSALFQDGGPHAPRNAHANRRLRWGSGGSGRPRPLRVAGVWAHSPHSPVRSTFQRQPEAATQVRLRPPEPGASLLQQGLVEGLGRWGTGGPGGRAGSGRGVHGDGHSLTYVCLGHDIGQPVGGAAAPALGGRGRGGGGGGAVDGLADPVLHVDAALAGGGRPLGVALH